MSVVYMQQKYQLVLPQCCGHAAIDRLLMHPWYDDESEAEPLHYEHLESQAACHRQAQLACAGQ